MQNEKRERQELSRRRTLGLLAGVGAAFAFGCGQDATGSPTEGDGGGTGADGGEDAATSPEGAADAGSANDSATTGDGGACAETPEGEIGPYFADDSDPRFNRSNILSNLDGSGTQSGIPLTLTVTVVDTENACAPYVNAQVDIWHCNSAGVYSDQAAESTTTEQWLRGYQLTDSNGKVTFVTIIPGWYSGRTTHIHLRLRSTYSTASSTTDGTNTTQLFFSQAFDDMVSTTVAPYSAEGANPTTNASDRVYSEQEDGDNVLAVSGDTTNGYTASVTIYLPIAAATSTGGGGPGM